MACTKFIAHWFTLSRVSIILLPLLTSVPIETQLSLRELFSLLSVMCDE